MCKETCSNMNTHWKKYLLWFAQEHVDFRFSEIYSIISAFNLPMKFIEKPTKEQPFWLVEFPSENELKILASRSVSLRSCQELWAHAKDVNSLHEKLKNFPQNQLASYFDSNKTFKIEVETFCRHVTQKEKIEKIEGFSYLPVKGTVNLKNPDLCMQYIEYYGTEPNNSPEQPYEVFFGRWISNGLRQLITKLSLKTRKFIGNTSMDAQLSLLMANHARVRDGDLILDPFVGSGSLLIAAAQFGGYVFGTDIDYLMLHAKTRPTRISQQKREVDESVLANLKQYNLEHKYLDLVVNDFALPLWRKGIEFDAIITDPPYGIRESTERIGILKDNYEISTEHLETHIPAKVEYGLSRLYSDLLIFAANYLKLHGRLVCWFPVYREDYTESCLPKHPSLKLVANCEQVLSKFTSRRLLTYEKISEEEDAPIMMLMPSDFRERYFNQREESRKERRMKKYANVVNKNFNKE